MKMTAENPKQKCTLGAEMGPSLYNQIFNHFYFWGKNTKIYGKYKKVSEFSKKSSLVKLLSGCHLKLT